MCLRYENIFASENKQHLTQTFSSLYWNSCFPSIKCIYTIAILKTDTSLTFQSLTGHVNTFPPLIGFLNLVQLFNKLQYFLLFLSRIVFTNWKERFSIKIAGEISFSLPHFLNLFPLSSLFRYFLSFDFRNLIS